MSPAVLMKFQSSVREITKMDRLDADHAEPQPSPKRKQKFVDFALQPGDDALLPSLPDAQRLLLQTEGSYQDRAERLGIPIGTVRSRLHRARTALERLREHN